MKIFRKSALDSNGFGHHIVLPIIVIALVALIGVRVIIASHAASVTDTGTTEGQVSRSIDNCPNISSVYVPPTNEKTLEKDPKKISKDGVNLSPQLTSFVLNNHPTFLKHLSCKPITAETGTSSSDNNAGINKFFSSCQKGDNAAGDRLSYLCESSNWSGYGTTASNVYQIEMSWVVPTVESADPQGGSTAASIWPGIGFGEETEGSTDELVQAGTDVESGCTPTCYNQYVAWYEQYPNESEREEYNIPIQPGDTILEDVGYDQANDTAYFYTCDVNDNLCVNPSQHLAAPTQIGAEWIVERPEINGLFEPLVKFGSVNITDAYVLIGNQGTWQPLGSTYDTFYDLDDCNNNLLDTIGYAPTDGQSNFTVSWYQFGQTTIASDGNCFQ